MTLSVAVVMVFSTYTKQRILYLRDQGHKAPVKLLSEEHVRCTRVWIAYFLKRFDKAGSIKRCAGSGRPLRITAEIVLCIHLIVPLVCFGGWSSCFLSPQNEPAKFLTAQLTCSTCVASICTRLELASAQTVGVVCYAFI